ncbi:MAG: integrase [Candidatus Bathyarchaeota archaeon]|nr:integrase [Candidatus Bathyarchaeota archaeon]
MLKNRSRKHAKDVTNYAKKYCHCLLKEDFSELRSFSPSKRRHVLAALSNLSKFLGRYEDFKKLIRNYGLKWESVKVEDLLISRLKRFDAQGSVLEWVKVIKERFSQFSVFMDFVTVSGLRLVEAIESYNLMIDLSDKGKLNEYYDVEREVLEHFRFKQLFIRNNKKAFASFVPKQLVKRISREERLTISKIYNRIKRKGFKPRFSDVREYYATYMTKYLTQSEIDFLQGRVSGSVFMRNYFNPALLDDLKERVFKGIKNLKVLA